MIIERDFVRTLVERVGEPRNFIQILKGPRQTGKTTALLQLKEKVTIPVLDAFASIDSSSRDWLRAKWIEARNLAMEKSEALLIVDEVQIIDQWSSVVKELWDEDTRNKINLKVVLSGSSSQLLEQGVKGILIGRFEMIQCA